MRILVVGSSGMLGYVTYRYLKAKGHQVSGITRTKFFSDMTRLDATEEPAIRRFLEETAFDAVINCAALLLKPSEAQKCEAVKLNAWLPHLLDAYCAQNNAYLIQVSTDAVFSGRRGGYREDEPSDADTFYGKSKLLGEVCSGHALTVRSGFWGMDVNSDGAGLLQWFLRQSGSVSGYTHALFNGVSNLEFARFADAALQNRWTGLYHLCAAESVSKYAFLCHAKRVFSRETEVVQFDNPPIDRTLYCTRADVAYQQKPFVQMLEELNEWWAHSI